MQVIESRGAWPALSLAVVLALCACGSDPTGFDDHADPEGVVLRLNGQMVASYDGDARSWIGELAVGVGQQPASVSVLFVDHDGGEVQIEEDAYFEVIIDNTDVAAFVHDVPGGFSGRLQGRSAGQTTAVFRLMHGVLGLGHPDFETTPLTVSVHLP